MTFDPRSSGSRPFDGFAGSLALDQLAQGEFVLVLELPCIEMAGLLAQDVAGKVDHLLGNARAGNPLEEVLFVAHFVVVAQRGAQQSLAPGLDGQDVLPVREHDARKGDAALVLHRVADDGERFLSALGVGYDVVRPLVVALVDFLFGNELVDIDGVRALDLDRIELLRLDFHVLAAGQLIAAALVVLVDDTACFLVDHLLAQAIAGLAVDLVETGLLGLARSRIEGDRAGHQRELEIPFPVCARGRHDDLP